MTIASTPSEIAHAGDGVSTVFTIPFVFDTSADLKVIETAADSDPAVVTTGFSIAGGGGSTGTLTRSSALPVGTTLTILDDPQRTQTADYATNDAFPAAVHEGALDRTVRQVKRLHERVDRSLRVEDGDLSDGDNLLVPIVASRQGKFLAFDANGQPTASAGTGGGDSALRTDLASAAVGADGSRLVGYRRTETGALARSVFAILNSFLLLTDFSGVDATGVSNSTTGIQAAINTGKSILIPEGSYLCGNLTQSTNFQQLIGVGRVHFNKNANGALLTSSGHDAVFDGIDFRDAGSAFTGKGLICSGDRVRVVYCGGYLIADTALEMTGGAPRVDGTCNIWHTRTAAGYDIVIGVSGTATLYPRVSDVYTSQAGGGIKLIDTGSALVSGGQFGKLTVENGTGPVGVNGGIYVGNRILGAVEVGVSSSVFTGNQFGAVNVHFAAGTSGHRLDESNVFQVGATIDDDSNESYVVNTALIPELQSFAIAWSASGVAPALGNGTMTAWYTRQGRRVFFTMELVFGTTTTPGTGNWTFTLPYAPAVKQIGVAQAVEDGVNTEGGIVAFAGGSATFQVFPSEAPSNAMGSAVPFAWGTADRLCVTGEYYTDP